MGFLRIRRQRNFLRLPVVRSCNKLLSRIYSSGGRGNTGGLLLLHRGGGLRRRYRFIDFRKIFWNYGSIVMYNEYDPNRTSLVSLICYFNGVLSYILSTEGIFAGTYIFNGSSYGYIKSGNTVPLVLIPEGHMVHSLEISPGLGSQFVRSAGTFALIVKKFYHQRLLLVRLPSKEELLISFFCVATIGRVSRYKHKLFNLYKAGLNRLRGFRPTVRGVAKNPIDHPHGGGGGRCLVTPWSKVAKNSPTRRIFLKRRNKSVIVLSRKVVRKRKRGY